MQTLFGETKAFAAVDHLRYGSVVVQKQDSFNECKQLKNNDMLPVDFADDGCLILAEEVEFEEAPGKQVVSIDVAMVIVLRATHLTKWRRLLEIAHITWRLILWMMRYIRTS